MISTSRRNKDIAIAVLNRSTYLDAAIFYDISWERTFQITRKLCLQVDASTKHDIRDFRKRANEIIPKINEIPEVSVISIASVSIEPSIRT